MVSFNDMLGEMENFFEKKLLGIRIILAIHTLVQQSVAIDEVEVNTKYKMVEKKVKLVVAHLPKDNLQWCVDLIFVVHIVIFIVPHVSWNQHPNLVAKAPHIDQLKEKVSMGILGPSNAPYLDKWFIIPENNGPKQYIQDLVSVNSMKTHNTKVDNMDKIAKATIWRLIYYEKIQLYMDNRNITMVQTLIGLLSMFTLLQGASNSVSHIMKTTSKVLKDCISDFTMSLFG